MESNKLETLKRYFGYSGFRPGQGALIDALLAGGDALGIMPTGAGKSVCYQLPALMREGSALVISPLISLMKDQVASLKAAGVPAAYINSSLTPAQQTEALRRASLNWYKVIYVAPERLDALEFALYAREAKFALIAVDEAHCVSQWGQDFRPSYLKIADFIESLPTRPPVGAFTATATEVVKGDIARLLRLRAPLIVTTGFDRPNLRFAVRKPKDKYSALLDVIAAHPDSAGIVYCSTRKNVEEVCERLRADGLSATRYHAGLADAERRENQEAFQYDRALIMVATNAFGMGIDKSNVYFVVHYNMPKNIESYYQEAGRAGRDGGKAECVLLYEKRDVVTAKWMIEHSEDNPELTGEERAQVRQRDLERLKQMTFYCSARRCLRAFLLNYFGERAPEACGNCSVCEKEIVIEHAPAAKRSASPKKDELYNELKALRDRYAMKLHIPPYMVFQDATLREMAAAKPVSREGLLMISGVGERKLARYGEAFMDVIRGSSADAVEVAVDDAPRKKPRPERANEPWDDDEDDMLRDEFERDLPFDAIAKAHGRSLTAIKARLSRLGLLE